MKVKNIKIGIRSHDTAFAEWADTFAKVQKGGKVAKKRGVYFTDLEAMRRVLTEKRLELLRAIKDQQPDSVYELAKSVKRDIKNVNEDLVLLRDMDLVSLTRSRKGRERLTPKVNYDKIQLEIGV